MSGEDEMLKGKAIRRRLTGALVIAAASFPSAAQARLNLNPETAVAGAPAQAAVSAPVRPTGNGAQTGFRWGDAGIGAVGAAALLGAGMAASAATRRRRTHRTVTG